MLRRVTFLVGVLVLILVLTSTVFAQGPAPQHSDPFWQASYWNNMTLSGAPVLQRQEPAIDYDWGTGSPQPGVVNNDQFSARWSRYIEETPGTYRFTATSDDGIRLWVDGALIIDDWSDHAVRTVTADHTLGAGHHLIVVEYYENAGLAVAKVSWAPVIHNWRGEYFNNMDLSGSPALVRDDAQINFDWGAGSPASGVINNDHFSARWTQTLNLPAGNYTFAATTDDGVRLWVNGHLLIDVWQVQSVRTFTGNIFVPAGGVEIKMEYFENAGLAVAKLAWSLDSEPPPPGGSVIVDDVDPGFVKGGIASSWRVENEGYNGRLLWTKNNNYVRPGYNWARWYPNLAPGRYEVFVYIPERFTTTSSARYWVSHFDGYTLRVVSQSANGGSWVSLGTYRFRGTDADYVSLADPTYEPYLSTLIAFDAIRWDPR